MDPRLPKSLATVNRVFRFLNRAGLATGPVSVLTVAGRKSGALHSTPVTAASVDGHRYLVAGYSDLEWAKNVRAANARGVAGAAGAAAQGGAAGTGPGVVTLARGRRSERVRLNEITDADVKRKVVVAYAHTSPYAAKYLVDTGASPDRTDAGFAAAATQVAVFEVLSA